MFDFALTELVVVGAIALIVIGPERLPKVARTAGLLFGRAQRYVSEIKADINNQLKLEELRKIEADIRAKASSAEHMIIEETQRTGQEFKNALESPAPIPSPDEVPSSEPLKIESEEQPAPASPQLELGLNPAHSKPETPNT